jgi:hypothetical protein
MNMHVIRMKKKSVISVIFVVFTPVGLVMMMMMMTFWVLALRRLVSKCRCFGVTYWFLLQAEDEENMMVLMT